MIIEDTNLVDNRVRIKENKSKNIIDKLGSIFNMKIIPYILVLFFVASLNILGVQPLAYVMLGVAIIFKIPLLIPLIVSILSFIVFKVPNMSILNYGITYILYTLFTAAITVEGLSKKYITFTKLIISIFISSLICLCFEGYNISNILRYVINILLVMATYTIFINGCNILFNLTRKIIFSKEEIVSFILIISMVLMPFVSASIYGVKIVKVALLILVVVAGWQNDWLMGSAVGVILGLIYGIISGDNTGVIITFVFSGLVAGILNRFNKWILAIAFLIGNFIVLKIFSESIFSSSYLLELIVCFIAVVGLPNKFFLKLEEIFNQGSGLVVGYENKLGPASDVKNRLGAISEVFENLSTVVLPETKEYKEETKEVIQKYILDYISNECISCKQKGKCIKKEWDKVSEKIAERLEKGKIITKEMLPIDCNLAEELITNIQDIYNNMKLMRIVQIKENEANKKMSEEYRSVANLIKGMSKEMDSPKKVITKEQMLIREDLKFMGYIVYEDVYKEDEGPTYEFITDILTDIEKAKKDIQGIVSDALHTEMKIKLVLNSSKTEKSRIRLIPSNKYNASSVVKQIKKMNSDISGDSYLITELKDNSKIFAISDGMGSGTKSKEVSRAVINMIEKLTDTGLGKNEVLDIINSVIAYIENKNISATLDMCVLDEKKDTLEFVKIGANKSFVIKNKSVQSISEDNMPIGLIKDMNYYVEEVEVQKNMFVVLASDGASDVNEKMLQDIVNNLEGDVTETKLMDKIMDNIIGIQNRIILDDITLIVCKII